MSSHPSLSHQLQGTEMLAQRNPDTGTERYPSLATAKTAGSFAAAARAAELKAIQANKRRAREAADEYKPPEVQPLVLGSLKFTQSRRG